MEYKKRRSGSSVGTRSVDGMLLPRRRYDVPQRVRPHAPSAPSARRSSVSKPAWQASTRPTGSQKLTPYGKKTKSKRTAQTRRPRFRTPVFAAVAFTLVIGAFLGGHTVLGQKQPASLAVSAVTASLAAAASTATAPVPANADPLPTLSSDMQAALRTVPGVTAAATLMDLKTGRTYQAGQTEKLFPAASTAKLVGVVTYLQKVEHGKASLNQKISGVPARTLIQRMIVNSDNAAWSSLNTVASYTQQAALLKSLGINGTLGSGRNALSTDGLAQLLKLLNDGTLLNAEHTALVKDYMAHTTSTDLIPAALPADVTVYHKYGQLGSDLHDAAILEINGRSYVLVVYTEAATAKASNAATQTGLIHAVTKAAYADIAAS